MGSAVHPSSTDVTARMQKQARRDTDPELQLRRALYALGRRYRVNYPVPGNRRRTIDIAFPRARLAVFVDGCFWHACPEHASWPRANAQWWSEKLAKNVSRDRQTDEQLRASGWEVVRIWEHCSVDDGVRWVVAALENR